MQAHRGRITSDPIHPTHSKSTTFSMSHGASYPKCGDPQGAQQGRVLLVAADAGHAAYQLWRLHAAMAEGGPAEVSGTAQRYAVVNEQQAG